MTEHGERWQARAQQILNKYDVSFSSMLSSTSYLKVSNSALIPPTLKPSKSRPRAYKNRLRPSLLNVTTLIRPCKVLS